MKHLLAAVWISLAGVASGHGDLHDSIQAVSRKIELAPADRSLFLERAKLYAAHHEVARALVDFDRAEALGADPAAIAPGRAKLQLTTGRYAEACRSLEHLLKNNPRHVEALVIRARARAGLHDAPGAVSDFTAAIDASPHPDPEYYIERAKILNNSKPPQTDAALSGLEDGLARLGKSVVTLQLAALELEVMAGRFDAALSRIDTAAATAPRKELWLSRRGDVLVRAGRPSAALQAYQEVLKCMDSLPPHLRSVRATVDLESRVRQAMRTTHPMEKPP